MADWHSTTAWIKARTYAKTVLDPVCTYCSKQLEGSDWTIDHIIPPNNDEPNHNIENLQSMCRSCNSKKQDKTQKRIAWHNPRYK
jgi:5-methylcytosine-specific restriction endonuclease McrA